MDAIHLNLAKVSQRKETQTPLAHGVRDNRKVSQNQLQTNPTCLNMIYIPPFFMCLSKW